MLVVPFLFGFAGTPRAFYLVIVFAMLQLVRWAERRLNPWAFAAPSRERHR